MTFTNLYDDVRRAESYATLEFPGTYFLAFRDLPAIIKTHVTGTIALDFGCGAGRSTRFLRNLGFETAGVDISEAMIDRARGRDPQGTYFLVADGDLGRFGNGTFDMVLSAFPFDNVPTLARKVACFREIRRVLKDAGRVLNLVSSPFLYTNEWASFSTKAFPENRNAHSGDVVRIVMTDVEDQRPVEDIFWTDESYREVYRQAGLEIEETYRPLGKPGEPHAWISELHIPPWAIYVLKKARPRS